MTEEEIQAAGTAEEEGAEDATVIRDTDIVFDCPHCGHNLCIDYRGAGLPINCTNCGESVLVPIPTGMKIDDLDQDPGELLKQLFKTRRDLQQANQRGDLLEQDLDEANERTQILVERIRQLAEQVEALKTLCKRAATVQRELAEAVEALAGDAAAEGASEAPAE